MLSRHKAKKAVTVLLILCICFAAVPVSADTPFTLTSVYDPDKIVAECQLTRPVADVPVAFYLLKPGCSIKDIDPNEPGSALEATVDIQIIKTSESGKAVYEYAIPSYFESGDYVLVAGVFNVLMPLEIEIFFASKDDKDAAVAAANESQANEEMGEVIDTLYRIFRVDDTYSIYSSAQYNVNKAYVQRALIQAAPFGNTNEFKKAFDEKVSISAINGAGEKNVFSVISRVNDYLVKIVDEESVKLDLSIYDSYDNPAKEIANKIMYNRNFQTIDEIFVANDEMEAVMAVNISDWQSMGEVLREYNDILELDLDGDYAKVGDKSVVHKAIKAEAGKSPFLRKENVRTAFNKAVAQALNPEKGKDGGTVGGGGGGGGSRTVISAPNPVPVATPVPAAEPFSDLGTVEWARESVNELYRLGIVNGTGDGLFSPNAEVTREQFVKMLVLAFNLMDDAASTDFGDVDRGNYFYPFIASAQKSGITTGQEDGNFGIGQRITRQQMAAMAYRAARIAGKSLAEGALDFADADEIDEYAAEAVGAMQSAGIINGMGDGTFAPNGTATRAQAAKIVFALLNL